MSEVLTRIRVAVARELRIDVDLVTPESTLEQLGADSLDKITVAMTIEDEFSIEVPDEDFESAPTIAGLVAIVERRLQEKANG
jgi:acyl carrier protein